MSSKQPLLTISREAWDALLRLRAQDPRPERLALRVAVTGESDGRYQHDMSFDLLAARGPQDVVLQNDDLPIVVPEESVEKLKGATLDVDGSGDGWIIDNPNRPKRQLNVVPAGGHGQPPSSPAVDAPPPEHLRESLQGGLGQRVATVLEDYVNPSIASHGGRAELVGVQEEKAYLRLSGGCQGCGMAAVTLRQGIERALRDLVPEIKEIVDVTDHESGDNPYYPAGHAH